MYKQTKGLDVLILETRTPNPEPMYSVQYKKLFAPINYAPVDTWHEEGSLSILTPKLTGVTFLVQPTTLCVCMTTTGTGICVHDATRNYSHRNIRVFVLRQSISHPKNKCQYSKKLVLTMCL